MFNLLPEPEKKQIIYEYNVRRLVVLLLFLFAVGLIAVASVFPSYLLVSAKAKEVADNLSSIKNSPIFAEEGDLTSELLRANQKLVVLRPPTGEAYLENILSAVIRHKTIAVRLNGFSFSRGSGGVGGLRVSGVAHNRDALSAFVDSLRGDPFFTAVDLPVSSLAKDQNADFSLDIKGKF